MVNYGFEPGSEGKASVSSHGEAKAKPSKAIENILVKDDTISFPSSFLIDLVSSIKSTLHSIKSIGLLSVDKSNDVEFRKYARRSIIQDIKKVDSVLNSLLNYIHISIPIVKTNTIHILLEEILEANETCLKDKSIKVIKKYGKSLPETFLHDEQVKFILSSLFQYAILSTPTGGSIGILTRSIDLPKGEAQDKVISLAERKGIEIVIIFTDHREPFEALGTTTSESKPLPKERVHHLILLLIKELIKKHQGMVGFAIKEKESRTLISLRLPVDRRQIIYYEQMNL